MVVVDALIGPLKLDEIEHGLELADGHHVAVHVYQIVRAVLLRFGGGVGDIGVDRNLRGADHGRFAYLRRIDGNQFGHVLILDCMFVPVSPGEMYLAFTNYQCCRDKACLVRATLASYTSK